MHSFHQLVGDNSVHCLVFGSGSELLVAFHGFGDDASSFAVLEPSLGQRFTIVSVDLPFHGRTEWQPGHPFTPQSAWALVEALMLRYNETRVSLAAFSIGGKIALKLFEQHPEKVSSLWLFAPDGLKNNVWYNIAVYPAWGRALFRWLLDRPAVLVSTVRLGKHVGAIPKSFAQFLEASLQRRDARERVWNTWLGIRGYEVSHKHLRRILRQSNTACYLIMGSHDPVIRPYVGRRFVKGLANAQLTVIPKGHYLLKPYLNAYINRILS